MKRLNELFRLHRPRLAQPVAEPGAPPLTVRVNSKDGLEYVWIPPGDFLMGALPDDREALDREKPQHPVSISKGFWLSKTPVTIEAYRRFTQQMGRSMPAFSPHFDPHWSRGNHPIVSVEWHDATAFCEWAGGRLPTEAEWEYALRAGKTGLRFPWGNMVDPASANFGYRHGGTTPVSQYAPNPWGLHDMVGNVCQWVADCYVEDYYATLPLDQPSLDPKAPEKPSGRRVYRGGAWLDPLDGHTLRSSYRGAHHPSDSGDYIGLRCVFAGAL